MNSEATDLDLRANLHFIVIINIRYAHWPGNHAKPNLKLDSVKTGYTWWHNLPKTYQKQPSRFR